MCLLHIRYFGQVIVLSNCNVLFYAEHLTVRTSSPTAIRCPFVFTRVKSKLFTVHSISDECKMKPKPLNPGQTVFYMVQPRFMNVDIRVMVDVTQGALDLFLSPRDDSFVVTLNSSTGYQDVRFFVHSSLTFTN